MDQEELSSADGPELNPPPDDASTDFSHLPDVVWVRILRFLSMKDRVNVSETCHTLNETFNHPSLWYSQKMTFMGENDNFGRKARQVFYRSNYAELVKRYGQYFQDLTIEILGHFRDMPKDLMEILAQISEKCRLESLTIDAGVVTSRFHEHYGFPPKSEAVKVLADFVRNAFRMKHLHIRSWPMYEKMNTDECNIFKVLIANEKLHRTLKTLTIFGIEDKEWSEREPKLLSDPTTTVELIAKFKRLTTLGLRSNILSNDLIRLLASSERAKLELLKVIVHYIRPEINNSFQIPNIRPDVWQMLSKRNPNFSIECTVFLQTPDIELANMLSPEVPISALTFMKYSKIDPQTVIRLYNHHAQTLTKFYSFCDAYDLDQALSTLAQNCKNLVEFVHHGEIHCNTIVTLAKARGSNWKRFEIRREKIKVPSEFDDVSDDEIFARNADGQLVPVALMRFHQPVEERDAYITAMTSEVSSILDVPWKPVD